MSRIKKYSNVCNTLSREWKNSEMEKLNANDWKVWIKDRLHQVDGLPGPNVRMDEAWEDIFLDSIPRLNTQNTALQGLILSYKDAIEDTKNNDSTTRDWKPEALGALILVVRLLITRGNDEKLAKKINEMTTTLLQYITNPLILRNKARDPYIQARYLLEDKVKKQQEIIPLRVDAWLTSRNVCKI